jgi:hypothetical protein
MGMPRSVAPKVQLHLESKFWEVIVQSKSAERVLSYEELQRQFTSAATVWVPVSLNRLPDGLAPALLNLLLESPPPVPYPLACSALIDRVRAVVDQRKAFF